MQRTYRKCLPEVVHSVSMRALAGCKMTHFDQSIEILGRTIEDRL